MKRVVKHIEQLLYKEECVVVPGLGAFIRHQKSASLDTARGLIYPGKSEITFNAALSQGDGLLVQSYSEAFSFGYKRAQSLLESDVLELKATLADYGVVQIGEIGKLMQDRSDGRVTFIPNPDHPFSIDYYGLQPVAMLPKLPTHVVDSEVEHPTRRNGDIYYLPINLRAIKYGTAAAVIAALALLIPSQKLTSPSDGKVQYQAGFLTTQKSVEAAPDVDESTPVMDFSESEAIAERQSSNSFEVVHTPIGQERYYVVIASLSSEVQYNKYIANHTEEVKSFDGAGVIISDTYHRVYAASFDTQEDARAYLKELNQKPEYSSSWIYKSK